MPQIMTVFSVVSAVVGAVQQVSQGMAQAASYQNQARAMDANSKIAELNAAIAGREGKMAAAQTAQDWHKLLGRQRAAMAQGGVLESATGLLVRQEAEERAKSDEFSVQFQSDMKKHGFQFQAADLRSQAHVARQNAGQARLGGVLGGMGSLAGGLSNAYGYHLKYGQGSP